VKSRTLGKGLAEGARKLIEEFKKFSVVLFQFFS